MIGEPTIGVAGSMATRLARAAILALWLLKIGYVCLVFFIAWEYYVRPQDGGVLRQEITFLHFFWLAFPLSVYVDFWILMPLIALDYLLGGSLSATVSGRREIGDIFVLLVGCVNAVAGYHQWFTIVPRWIKKTMPYIRSLYLKLFH